MKPLYKTPEETMRAVTVDMGPSRAPACAQKGRSVSISKTAKGKAVDLETIDPILRKGPKPERLSHGGCEALHFLWTRSARRTQRHQLAEDQPLGVA